MNLCVINLFSNMSFPTLSGIYLHMEVTHSYFRGLFFPYAHNSKKIFEYPQRGALRGGTKVFTAWQRKQFYKRKINYGYQFHLGLIHPEGT